MSTNSPRNPAHCELEAGSDGSRHLDDPVRTFALEELARQASEDAAWNRLGHNATTLVKFPGFRVVLMVLAAGARIEKHRTDGWISVQTLRGHARLTVEGKTIDLPQGSLVALERSIPHDVAAVVESEVLLSISL